MFGSERNVPGTGNYFEFPYADLPTFGKAPIGTTANLADADIGVFGIPWDTTATLRPGARLGPRRIREQTAWFEQVWNPSGTLMQGFEAHGERERERISIVDCGDATVVPTDTPKTTATIREVAAAIAASAFPLMLGGDHYVMFPTYQGVTDSLPGEVVGIVQFDAHNDLIDDDEVLGKYWSGTPIRRSIEHAGLDPHAVAQIGLRGFVGENERPAQRAEGFQVVPMSELRREGPAAVAVRVMDAVLAHCDAVYLTVDIDSVDPSCAPGCCTPVPGGMLAHEFLELLRELGRYREIVAMDLVEVAPPLDPTEQTSILAAHGLFSFIEQRFLRTPK
ncbi:MAG: agmatinase family protein [bacterium]